MKTTRIAASLFVLSLLGAACGGGSAAAPSATRPATAPSTEAPGAPEDQSSGTDVTIQDFAFAPKKPSLAVGDTVSWTNADDILHTVTSGVGQKQGVPGVTKDKAAKPDGLFDQEVELDDTFEFTFAEAGSYKYFCAIHPGMVGTVVVE